jgi:hypothetical protein
LAVLIAEASPSIARVSKNGTDDVTSLLFAPGVHNVHHAWLAVLIAEASPRVTMIAESRFEAITAIFFTAAALNVLHA